MLGFMKMVLVFLLALPPAFSSGAQGRFSRSLDLAEGDPFIVVDKQASKLFLVDPVGATLREYGSSCAVNYGPKRSRGDHKTPEGIFKITEVLNSRGLSHDFKDGNGPVPEAYGPWFLRLNVPGFVDIGIHGTPFPESIGTRATEGCIRLRNEDITDLKQRVGVGTTVIILPDPPASGKYAINCYKYISKWF